MKTNPYAATLESTVQKQFRCTWLRRVLTRIIAGRRREPRFDAATGEHELFQAGTVSLVTSLCLFCPFLLVAATFWGVSPSLAAIGSLLALSVAALLWLSSESVYFTAQYVRRFGPFRRHARIEWDRLQSLEVAPSGDLVLADDQKHKIWVHCDLRGQHVFAAMLREVVSPDLLEFQQTELAEWEKLVC